MFHQVRFELFLTRKLVIKLLNEDITCERKKICKLEYQNSQINTKINLQKNRGPRKLYYHSNTT